MQVIGDDSRTVSCILGTKYIWSLLVDGQATAIAQIEGVVRSSILILSTLFPVVNPLGNSPVFLALTPDYSTEERTLLSQKIALNGWWLLVASILIGTHILAFFGISLPVVQVGGGLLVIVTAWNMLNRPDDSPRVEEGPCHPLAQHHDLSTTAFYPLTLPLTVGPGSISVAITLGANQTHSLPLLGSLLSALLGSALVAVTIFLCYRFAQRIAEILGETVMNVILRLSSFILLCIGVQIAWNGVAALLRSLPRGA
jgi:multiple antibiotic resistance protein